MVSRSSRKMKTTLVIGVVLLLAGLPAQAQPVSAAPDRTDCNSPVGSIEQWICSSRHLRQLQDQIADTVGRLVQMSPRGQTLQSEQSTWSNNTYRRRALGNVFLREAMIDRLREVRRIAALTEAGLHEVHVTGDVRATCVIAPPPHVDPEGLKCEVVDTGPLGNAMFFQRQSWQPETGSVDPALFGATGVLIFDRVPEKEDALRLVGWDVEESSVAGSPDLVMNPKAGSFLRMPMITSGTSGADLGTVLHRETPDQPWREFNASGWFTALTKRAPASMTVKSAYDLNLAALIATVTLARDSDSSCCPTGGKGTVHLALRGDQLIIDSVDWAIPTATGGTTRVRR